MESLIVRDSLAALTCRQSVTRTYWISVTDLGTWIGGKGYTA